MVIKEEQNYHSLKISNSERRLDNPKELEEWRGFVINQAINIELTMDFLLTEFFCKRGTNDAFLNSVLDKEFFTFFQKIKLFKELQIHKPIELKDKDGEDKYMGYYGKLCYINKIRNAFAHGLMSLSDELILVYTYKTKEEKIKLDTSFKQKFLKTIKELKNMLDEVYDVIRDKNE